MYAAAYRNTERGARIKQPDRDPDLVVTTFYPRATRAEREKISHIEAFRRAEAARKEAEAARELARQEKAARMVDEAVAKYGEIICSPGRPDTKQIIRQVAQMHGCTYVDIIGPSRKKPIVDARFACVRAVADARPDLSTPMIGRLFNRDHTSILNSLKKTRQPGSPR